MTPRVLPFVTVKRNTPLAGRSFGPWWIEVDDQESYGWWPARLPVRFRDALRGVPGVLNGVGVTDDGTATRDPNHGQLADYEFHPVLITAGTDDDVRDAIRSFATSFVGEWRWWTRPSMNCRLFQLELFDTVGLVDGTGNYRTRGQGCPALAPVRRAAGRLDGQRRWPRNLPAPGRRAADVLPDGARCPSTSDLRLRLPTS